MSNSLAICTVTACIRQVLLRAIDTNTEDPITNAQVTSLNPGSSELPTKGINVYLARVTPNAAFRGSDLPTRGGDGQLLLRPQLALDLHYLLAFRGDEQYLEPQRLMGVAMRVLSTQPLLTKEVITQTISALSGGPLNYAFMAQSNLADALESVRLTLEPLSTEELSKIWSAYPQASQVAWTAYQASVVVLDSEQVLGSGLPVLQRGIYVDVIAPPRISTITAGGSPESHFVAGASVSINGTNLSRGVVEVLFDGTPLANPPSSVSPKAIDLTLPAMLAGSHVVQLIRTDNLGGTGPHRLAESNPFAFTLVPSIDTIVASNVSSTGTQELTRFSADVSVACQPTIGANQKVELLLNRVGATGGATAFGFAGPPRSVDATAIVIQVRGLPAGTYVARLRVDGAASPLGGGGSTAYSSPTITF